MHEVKTALKWLIWINYFFISSSVQSIQTRYPYTGMHEWKWDSSARHTVTSLDKEGYQGPTILAPGLLAATFVQAEQYRRDYTAPNIFCQRNYHETQCNHPSLRSCRPCSHRTVRLFQPLPADHDKHHPQAKVKTQTSAMGMGEGHEEMRGNADQMAFCAMPQELMSASPEERRAVMAEHMKTMPPDMMKKHMEMMGTQMDMMREHMNSSMM